MINDYWELQELFCCEDLEDEFDEEYDFFESLDDEDCTGHCMSCGLCNIF